MIIQSVNDSKKSKRRAVACLLASLTLIFAGAPGAATAQDYPNKPIRLVIPYAAGGTTDVVGRILAKHLGDRLKQPVIVENRPGASGRTGAEYVAKSAPDGYTLVYTVADPFSIIPHLFRNVSYDALNDFTPVAMIGSTPMSLAVSTRLPVQSLQDFVRLAKQNPGKFTYGSWGMGSGAHIRMEAFKAAAGIDLMHVPFQGSSPAFTALLGAHIDAMIVGVGLTAAQHQGGKVRVLAVDSKERDPSLPEVPTFAEQGLSIDLTFWNGVVAPAKTPPAVLDTLNKAINEITGDPQVRREMETAGMVVNQPGTAGTGVGLPQVRSFYENEYARWGKVIRDANISATE